MAKDRSFDINVLITKPPRRLCRAGVASVCLFRDLSEVQGLRMNYARRGSYQPGTDLVCVLCVERTRRREANEIDEG